MKIQGLDIRPQKEKRRKRKEESAQKQKAHVVSKQLLYFQPPPTFENEPLHLPEFKQQDYCIRQLDDNESLIYNLDLCDGLTQKCIAYTCGEGECPDLEQLREHRSAIQEWIFRFYTKRFGNTNTFLSHTSAMCTCYLAILYALSPSLEDPAPLEREMFLQCVLPRPAWSIEVWESKLSKYEAAAARILFTDTSEDQYGEPQSIHRDARIEMIERTAAWQFWVRSQIHIIQDREATTLEILPRWRAGFDALFDEYVRYKLPDTFYQEFVTIVHSFMLPVASKQRFLQRKKQVLARVEVSSVWETMMDEDTGREVHEMLPAETIGSLWKDSTHRFHDLFVLQLMSTYFWEMFRCNFCNHYIISPFDFPDRYLWSYRKERNLQPRSPLIVHLLDKWYVLDGVEKIFSCNTIEHVVLTWFHLVWESGGKTDDLINVRSLLDPIFAPPG